MVINSFEQSTEFWLIMQKPTPMLRQYLDLKKRYPGTLLFFRLGDFYELFNEDAVIGARELDITLTARHKNTENPVPMCGVPHHAAANYISRLVRKGYRIAICEQVEDASQTKKLVKREVVRIVTPGTAIDEQLLEKRKPVYLASISGASESFGVAYLELSTGEFFASQFDGRSAFTQATSDIESFSPRELLFPDSLKTLIGNSFGNLQTSFSDAARQGDTNHPSSDFRSRATLLSLTQLAESKYDHRLTESHLIKQFEVKDLKAYGVSEKFEVIRAAGACLSYALETQRATAKHITEITYCEASDSMVLDPITLRNLEIVESNGFDGRDKATLLGVIDETVTGMGGRLLRSWLLRPSIKRSEIETRILAVSEFTDNPLRDKIRFLLQEIADLERLIGRLNLGTATPRDLTALSHSLSKCPKIIRALSDATSLLLQVLSENVFPLPELQTLISTAIADEPPVNISDRGIIREGFNAELDALRGLCAGAKTEIAGFEASEREATGISSLKVKFNNVFGYFIEVSKINLARVPVSYERRQTLTNAERYTTPQLKEWETRVLGADEKIGALEHKLFSEILVAAANETRRLQSTARALATIDALASLAETAVHRDYVQPVLHDHDLVEIKNGRHPVIEVFTDGHFVPNDLVMNNSTDRLLVITGANMGGKSTLLRQVALIQILAQIGSFVPASFAKLPIIDRVWTRVGASDDLASGRSTFMVEMTETATILRNATPRSLIILDEIGRGTSTFDGLAIAWAVAEYLHNSPDHSAKTLFATHYHELTELASILPGAKNYQMTAKEKDGDIVFLHKLEKGKASKSYGIAVAKLAGLPPETIAKANEVLEKLERYELAIFTGDEAYASEPGLQTAIGNAAQNKLASQVSLFAISNESIIDELRLLDTEGLTPDESKELLGKMKSKIV